MQRGTCVLQGEVCSRGRVSSEGGACAAEDGVRMQQETCDHDEAQGDVCNRKVRMQREGGGAGACVPRGTGGAEDVRAAGNTYGDGGAACGPRGEAGAIGKGSCRVWAGCVVLPAPNRNVVRKHRAGWGARRKPTEEWVWGGWEERRNCCRLQARRRGRHGVHGRWSKRALGWWVEEELGPWR